MLWKGQWYHCYAIVDTAPVTLRYYLVRDTGLVKLRVFTGHFSCTVYNSFTLSLARKCVCFVEALREDEKWGNSCLPSSWSWPGWGCNWHLLDDEYIITGPVILSQFRGEISLVWMFWRGFMEERPSLVAQTVIRLQWGRPGLGRSLEKGTTTLSKNFIDTGAWQTTVHGVAKSWTWLSNFHFCGEVCLGFWGRGKLYE